MKVLVCGGRDYADRDYLWRYLSALHQGRQITEIVHGSATGADTLAGEWAKCNSIKVTAVPADWKGKGKAAGYLRNKEMLGLKPDLVVAFPGGRGTENMVRLSQNAGVPTVVIEKPGKAVFADASQQAA